MKVTTMEGTTQYVSQGPTAAIVPIKQLGTNGVVIWCKLFSSLGEPYLFANMVECWSILIIPMAMAFAFGFYLKRKNWVIVYMVSCCLLIW